MFSSNDYQNSQNFRDIESERILVNMLEAEFKEMRISNEQASTDALFEYSEEVVEDETDPRIIKAEVKDLKEEQLDFNRHIHYHINNMDYIKIRRKLTIRFMELVQNKQRFNYILNHEDIFNKVNEKYYNNVDWIDISQNYRLSEDFMIQYQDKLNWAYISQFQRLSEEFILKFHNRISWFKISKYQSLSREFINKHKNKLRWTWIVEYQEN